MSAGAMSGRQGVIPVLALLMIAMTVSGAPVEMELLLADFEGPPTPGIVGQAMPEGCTAEVSADRVRGGARCCRLHYRYPGVEGISYSGFALRGLDGPLVGEPQEFRVWVHGDGVGQSLRLRLTDATGQTHQFNVAKLDFTGWRQVSCALTEDQGHWGGANDGVLHYPLGFDSLLVDSDVEPSESDMYFDDLTYVTLAEPAAAMTMGAESGWFGNVVTSAEPWRLKLTVRNRRADGAVAAPLEVVATDSRGQEVGAVRSRLELGPGEAMAVSLAPGGPTRGLVTVRASAGETPLYEGRLAVLPEPHALEAMRDPFFGACTHFGQGKHSIPDTLQLMRRAGVEFLRDELYWGAIETEAGRFTFPERFDAYMRAAAAAGVQPLIVTTYSNALYDEGQAPHTDEGRAAYARYVTELIRHYGDLCHRWEVWNEPNIGFWQGRKPDPGEYFELLKTTYEAVKKADPKATVVGVCTAGTDFGFIEGVLQRGGARYMDDLSTHPYRYPRSPEDSRFVEELRRTHELMAKYWMGDRKLWLTEIGWPTQKDPRGVDEQTSANYLVRMYVLARSQPYVAGVVWYDWQDDGPDPGYNEHNFGITKWQTSEAKAGLVAYWVMTHHLAGATLVRQLLPSEPNDRRHALAFRRGDRQVIVAWTAVGEDTASWSLGCESARLEWADARVEERRLAGGVLSLRLTEMPVFITGDFKRLETAAPILRLGVQPEAAARGDRLLVVPVLDPAVRDDLSGTLTVAPPREWRAGAARRSLPPPPEARSLDLPLSVPPNAPLGPAVFRAEVRSADGRLVAEASANVRVVVPLDLAWVPDRFEGPDRLRGLVVVRNNRSLSDEKMAVEVYGPGGRSALRTMGVTPKMERQCAHPFAVELPADRVVWDELPLLLRATVPHHVVNLRAHCYLWTIPRAAEPPVADGDLTEWDQSRAATAELRAVFGDFVEVDKPVWRDSADVSARCLLAHSDEGLHIAVEVRDDTHYQQYEAEQMWQGDSLQLALDPGCRGWRETVRGAPAQWVELGLARGEDGVMVHQWRPEGAQVAEGLRAAVVRGESATSYEMTVPWGMLGQAGPPGGELVTGFALLVNENDGQGREGWLALFDGIGYRKDPRGFGLLRFGECRQRGGRGAGVEGRADG